MKPDRSWALPVLLILASPATVGATTATVLPVDNAAGFSDAAVTALTDALRAELKREADLELVAAGQPAELRIQARLTRSQDQVQLFLEVQGADGRTEGTSRPHAVTESDVAARGREALAEARQRRAAVQPAGAVTAPEPTTVDGIALRPAGAVVTTAGTAVDGVTLRPAGAVVQPRPEVIEVSPDAANAGRAVPVKPADNVLDPPSGDLKPAGDVLDPPVGDLKPAGRVVAPGTETIADPGAVTTPTTTPAGAAPGADPDAAPTGPRPGDAYRYGGWALTAVTAVLGATAFAYSSQIGEEDDPDDRDEQILIAQVTGGLAGATAVVAVTLFLVGADAERAPSAGLLPVSGGAVATLGGRW